MRRKSRDVTLLVYGRGSENKTALVPELVRRLKSLGGDHNFLSVQMLCSTCLWLSAALKNLQGSGRILKPIS